MRKAKLSLTERGFTADDPHAPYVASLALPVKPYDQHCATCGAPYAPFGVGYPDNTVWYCRKHAEGRMELDGEATLRNVEIDPRPIDPSGQGVAGHVFSDQPQGHEGDAGGVRGSADADNQNSGRLAFTPIKLRWDSLNPVCWECGDAKRATTGVGYSEPNETRYYCREHLPDEFNEEKIKAKWRKR